MADTVLVTGCSTGIGRATARSFLDDGWQVYATAREPDEMAELDEFGATTMQLDVTSTEDVERVVERIAETEGKLDCLVNNAGFGQFGPLEDVPTADVREQFEVNVFGPHRLIRAALPQLREFGDGTVINVASVASHLPLPGIGAYASSKFALSGMSAALRQEVADDEIDIVVIEPALVATDFYDRAVREADEIDHSARYEWLYDVIERLPFIQRGGPGITQPREVADVILGAATDDSPALRYQTSLLAKVGVFAGAVLPETMRDRVVRLLFSGMSSIPVRRLVGK